MKNLNYKPLLFIFVITMFLTINCNTGTELSNSGVAGSEITTSEISSGTLNFFISSAVISGTTNILYSEAGTKEEIRSLVVIISELEVHRTGDSDAGWKALPLSGESFDLIELDILMWADLLSSTNPVKGEYNKIRLNVSSAIVTTDKGTFEAEVPGDKIKINISFSVHEDGTTKIDIAIDPVASLKSTGNKNNPKYFLNPVLKITSKIEE